MSDWETDRHIAAEISDTTGELMLSASDVVAWLRHCSDTMKPWYLYSPAITAIADRLTDNWIKAAREHLIDGETP